MQIYEARYKIDISGVDGADVPNELMDTRFYFIAAKNYGDAEKKAIDHLPEVRREYGGNVSQLLNLIEVKRIN